MLAPPAARSGSWQLARGCGPHRPACRCSPPPLPASVLLLFDIASTYFFPACCATLPAIPPPLLPAGPAVPPLAAAGVPRREGAVGCPGGGVGRSLPLGRHCCGVSQRQAGQVCGQQAGRLRCRACRLRCSCSAARVVLPVASTGMAGRCMPMPHCCCRPARLLATWRISLSLVAPALVAPACWHCRPDASSGGGGGGSGIQDWGDLLQPQLRGRVAFIDSPRWVHHCLPACPPFLPFLPPAVCEVEAAVGACPAALQRSAEVAASTCLPQPPHRSTVTYPLMRVQGCGGSGPQDAGPGLQRLRRRHPALRAERAGCAHPGAALRQAGQPVQCAAGFWLLFSYCWLLAGCCSWFPAAAAAMPAVQLMWWLNLLNRQLLCCVEKPSPAAAAAAATLYLPAAGPGVQQLRPCAGAECWGGGCGGGLVRCAALPACRACPAWPACPSCWT